MRNKPSLKVLEATFPTKGKALRRLLTNIQAVREHPAAIARERECWHAPLLSDLRMHALNAELECFGVEHARGRRAGTSFDYCNTGDSYGVTIIRFVDGRYRVGDWGTVVERDMSNYD